MTLGERIKEARLRKRLTQKQLAKLLNVTDATVNRYEKNVRIFGTACQKVKEDISSNVTSKG